MKFGKEFNTHLEQTLPEWRDKFLCYKPLKKILKNFPNCPPSFAADPSRDFLEPHQWPLVEDGAGGGGGAAAAGSAASILDPHAIKVPSLVDLHEWFLRILNEELEKFNDFYVDKEEEFVIRFQELKQRIEQVKEQSSRDEVFTSETEFSEEMMGIRKDFVAIHGEMVLLKNYSSLNFAGLIKILKKYDKRTGELLRLPFAQQAVHQPFITTEPLTRLVRECEANLELLFPMEAEVVESTPTGEAPSNSSVVLSTKTPSNLGEDTMNLYRGTMAAMSAIHGLQKESSTSNPLSFSSLCRCRDDESTGALTDENSPANSFGTSRNEPEVGEEEDDRSV